MSQGPWDSYKMLMQIRKQMGELFNDGLNKFELYNQVSANSPSWMPPFDLIEAEDEFLIFGELPGFRKEDLSLQFKGNELLIKGERRVEAPDNTSGYHLAERYYGGFQRSFKLPADIYEGRIKTTFNDGLLEVKLPKKQSKKETRTIPIK